MTDDRIRYTDEPISVERVSQPISVQGCLQEGIELSDFVRRFLELEKRVEALEKLTSPKQIRHSTGTRSF